MKGFLSRQFKGLTGYHSAALIAGDRVHHFVAIASGKDTFDIHEIVNGNMQPVITRGSQHPESAIERHSTLRKATLRTSFGSNVREDHSLTPALPNVKWLPLGGPKAATTGAMG